MKRYLSLLAVVGFLLGPTTAFSQAAPIARYQRLVGYVNYVATGGSLRTSDTATCTVGTSSSNPVQGIPAGATIRHAYLYWGGSGTTVDNTVTLNGNTVTANRTFTASQTVGGTAYGFFGGFADVTSRITGNGTVTFSGLTVNTGNPWCGSSAVLAGWSLIVIYERPQEPLRAINLFDGLQIFYGSQVVLTPDGFRVAPGANDGKITVVTWEGDPGNSDPLNGSSESLRFNGTALDDGLVPAGSVPALQQYDGTINTLGQLATYGVDVDTYDVSGLLPVGATSATTTYSAGGDLVLLTAQIVSTSTEPSVDLGLSIADTGDFVVGQPGRYRVLVTNGALNEAEDNPYTVTLTLPTGITYASASGTGWTCTAAAQVVTCSRAPTLAPGATAPELLVNVNVLPTAAASVTVTAVVDSASFDNNAANDTASDATPVRVPNLSTSTKAVSDVNGGDVEPGDILRYTITLRETANGTAGSAAVLDDIPGNTGNFTVIAVPPGALNQSTGSGTGANGNGLLDVRNITVPAGGSVTVIFEVTVAGSAAIGANIPNTATVQNPNGPGAAPVAPTLLVRASQIAASGSKPLYLRRNPGLVLSRTPANAGNEGSEQVNAGASRTWVLTPVLQKPLSIAATNIPVTLWLRRNNTAGTRTLRVDLVSSTAGTVSTATTVLTLSTNSTPQQFSVTLPNTTARTFPAGSTLSLVITQTAPATGGAQTFVHPNGATAGTYSNVGLSATTVINVDSVLSYNAASPAGALTASFNRPATAFVRAVVSDPFGSFDIAGSAITVTDSTGTVVVNNQPMTQVADSGAATRTYEYAVPIAAGAAGGAWTARVVATEGTEGLVTDFANGAFTVVVPSPVIRIAKTASLLSDPLNATTTPRSIPGSEQRYSITVTNTGPGTVDASTLVLADPIPPDVAVYVATSGGPPVELIQGSTPSGLTLDYATQVSWSNRPNGAAPFDYVPVPDANGYDANVTGVRIAPAGTFAAAAGAAQPSFTVRFRVRVK